MRRNRFVMGEKQEHPSARDSHSCSSKLVCPLSLVSLLICTATLVRVEIINQRVHDVEDLVTDARQNHNAIKVFTDAASFKQSKRVESVEEFHHKITEERRDDTEVHRTRRFSSEAGTKPDQLTMESVRVEINKTLSSLTSRSFCSSKQQICVQGPPGIQGRKGSRGRRGPRGVTGKKGTSGSRGKPGQRGKQGIMGPSGPKGEEGNMGAQGQKGEQGIMGSHGPKGNQGAMGKSGPKGNQGIMGPPGLKGKQGYMGPPGPKGSQGTMGPPGRNGEQGITGPPGTKGKQGIMGPKGGQGSIGAAGPRGIPGAKGEPGDSFQPPTLVISPMKHAITEKQSAVFQCSVGGNPKPTVTWLGKSGTPLRSMDGRLDVRHATFDDAGEYTCIGRNALGITSQTAFLTIIVSMYEWTM